MARYIPQPTDATALAFFYSAAGSAIYFLPTANWVATVNPGDTIYFQTDYPYAKYSGEYVIGTVTYGTVGGGTVVITQLTSTTLGTEYATDEPA
jgi:acyl dehydratase